MHTPSVAARNASGRLGEPYRRCKPSWYRRKIAHNISLLWISIRRVRLVRTPFRGAPKRIIFNASSTASLDRVCAGDGDVGGACRLSDALAFAINQPLVSCDASSMAQTDVQHLIANVASFREPDFWLVSPDFLVTNYIMRALRHLPCALLDTHRAFRPCFYPPLIA